MSEQKQSGFSVFVNKRILPPVMKFVNTKAIQALQNGMIYTLPFILIGSIFLILGNIPIVSWLCGQQLVLPIFMLKMKAMNH